MTASPRPLRIAVLGDFDGVHTRSWLRWFVDRGYEMHGVGFYPPADPPPGVTMHALRPRRAAAATPAGNAERRRARIPAGAARLVHGARYRAAGLRRAVSRIAPDVFHAHFVVEHGFYGAIAGVRPYVVTAWGSDILVEPERDRVSRMIARWTMSRADALTSNNAWMAERMVALGARRDRVHVVTLGADRYDLERADESVNLRGRAEGDTPVVISPRAHEPLYNIAEIIDAHARLARGRTARLVVAHGGSQTASLERRARGSGGHVEFTGFLDRAAFRDALAAAEVFVSAPSSDATSVALLQAMGAGAFPIVSDLPTQREWIEDGVNGFVVPLHRPDILADRMRRALDDPALRRRAAGINRTIVEERGLNDTQMQRLAAIYEELAARR